MSTSVLFWRRTDIEGLERLELQSSLTRSRPPPPRSASKPEAIASTIAGSSIPNGAR